MKKISCVIVRPGEKPVRTNISSSIKNLQKTVGGDIGVIEFTNDTCFIVKAGSAFDGSHFNFDCCGIPLFGTVIFSGIRVGEDGEDEFCDLPITYEDCKKVMPGAFARGKGEQ